ncbi:hypothetical protein [Natrononativus amylolyticus]|uniref:hypothetical protein n=1 Tax=Natrononativus amylolyticus TaxID=2963434 RepID=UPI0020CD20EC|nr:hypothetical protein [Natrononativus amylolyticus]
MSSSSIPRTTDEAKELLRSLLDRLQDAETRLTITEQRLDSFFNWREETDDRIGDLKRENDELRQRLTALEARVNVVEGGKSTKDGKIRQIVAKAENLRKKDQGAVVLTARDIVGATGVSRRYAYDLIDDLPEKHHWVITRTEARDRQFGNVEIDANKQTKAIVVDCEALHSDPEAVNKFTTTREGEDQ